MLRFVLSANKKLYNQNLIIKYAFFKENFLLTFMVFNEAGYGNGYTH